MSSVPTPGDLVKVRRRTFVVREVLASGLRTDPLRPLDAPQHLVRLAALDEDALGEELSVVWEVEPGAHVHESRKLPSPAALDPPARLDCFLDAVRWSTISATDERTLQAPFRAGIEIEDYQLDPLARALAMPRVNLLIADDVGLGKTIEAGLVMEELLLRHRARRVLVVAPAPILIQWRDQMRDKFGLEFRIVDAELMRQLRRDRGLRVNPWSHFPRLITSIDYLKRERPLRAFRETLPGPGEPRFPRRYDLLIVDEAHHAAPSGQGKYAIDSQRTLAIRELAPHFEHRLFLSATPHNGYWESFSALLELVDDQRFARGIRPDAAQVQAVMVRRLKSELRESWGDEKFPRRHLAPLEVPYSEGERAAHQELAAYARSRKKRSGSEGERVACEFVHKLLKKRLFSSPRAFLDTLDRVRRTLQGKASKPDGPLPPARLQLRFDSLDEDWADDELYESEHLDAVETGAAALGDLTQEEARLLDSLRVWAERAAAAGDTKFGVLMDWLARELRPGGAWSDTRVLVFTEYRATQKWLFEQLAAHGLTAGGRLELLYGGMDGKERERIKAAFQASPAEAPVRILLATDAASEGIDLQNHCSRIIHYEIPWNPNRMEQRIGRVDRHGQRAKRVDVLHFVGTGYRDRPASVWDRRPGDLEGDLEFLLKAALKVQQIREDLGKVGPVIARQVEEAMLGSRDALDTVEAEAQAAPTRAHLKAKDNLARKLRELGDQLAETRKFLNLEPARIRAVVETGLALAGQPPLLPRKDPDLFDLPQLQGAWARASEGLPHPHSGKVRPVTFDPARAKGRDDVVLAHLSHPLVALCVRLLREAVWSTAGAAARIHRFTAREARRTVVTGPTLVAHARLVVLGSDQYRLQEELVTAGIRLDQGRAVRIGVGETDEALAAALPGAAGAAQVERLREHWPDLEAQLAKALEARVQARTKSLEAELSKRRDRELDRVQKILDELTVAIRKELAEPEVGAQLKLFAPPEREQFEKNKKALEARLAEIPAERERELAQVQQRFADPAPRYFPICVTLLVPEGGSS